MTPHKKQKKRNENTVHPPAPVNDLASTTEAINLKVLRRYYPHVLAIVHIAPYAVLYSFSATQQWEKTGIEGTLFVVLQSSDHPASPHDNLYQRFSVIILNRRGLDNFAWELRSPDSVETSTEFIILSGDEGEETYGLWVFTEPPPSSTSQMREITAEILVECARRSANSIRATATQKLHDQSVKEQSSQIIEQEIMDQEVPSALSMARQLSLRDLFGKQRESDSGFSVQDHHSHQQTTPQQPASQPPKPAASLFKTNPDTEFFRTGTTPVKAAQTAAAKPAPGSIAIQDLFQK
jgi:Dcp1-like decapping family